MSPIVVLARKRRRSLLPFAAGFDATCIAALVWLDARKSLALEYDGESLDTPSRDESDQDRTRVKADAESERIDATQFRDKYPSNAHADSNSQTDRIESDSEKSSATDANADKAHLIPVTVVGSSAYPQIPALPSPTEIANALERFPLDADQRP